MDLKTEVDQNLPRKNINDRRDLKGRLVTNAIVHQPVTSYLFHLIWITDVFVNQARLATAWRALSGGVFESR